MPTKNTPTKKSRPIRVKPPQAVEQEPDVPVVDEFPIAFCIIATMQDWKSNAMRMMRSLPSNAQVCVLLNEQGTVDSMTDVLVQGNDQRTVRSRKWTYLPKTFSFAEARNRCHDMTTKDWVFWIDCDELLVRDQHDGLLDCINAHGGGIGGFVAGQASLSMYDNLLSSDKEPSYHNIKQVRLYRTNCGFKWEGYAHEQILYSIRDRGYAVIDTTLTVVHNGYSGESSVLLKKLVRNTTLIGRWLYEHDEHPLYKFYREIYSRDLAGLIQLEKQSCRLQDM